MYLSTADRATKWFLHVDGSANLDYVLNNTSYDKDLMIVFCSKELGSILTEKNKMLEGALANFDAVSQCDFHVNLMAENFSSGSVRINCIYLVSTDGRKDIEKKLTAALDTAKIDITYPTPRIIECTK